MSISAAVPWDRLDRWKATLFVVAAGMQIGAGVLVVLQETAGVDFPLVLLNVGGHGGLAVSLLGLLGLYGVLADRSPRLSKGGAVLAAIGAVSFAVGVVALVVVIGLNAGMGTNLPTELIGILLIPGYLGTILAYAAFGVASTRTGVPSRVLGGLFIALIAVPLAQMLGFILLNISLPTFAGLGVVQVYIPAVMLAIGFLLRSRTPGAGHSEGANEATAR